MIKVLNSFLRGTNKPNCPKCLSAARRYCDNKNSTSGVSSPRQYLKTRLSLPFSWTGITMKNYFFVKKLKLL